MMRNEEQMKLFSSSDAVQSQAFPEHDSHPFAVARRGLEGEAREIFGSLLSRQNRFSGEDERLLVMLTGFRL